MVVSLGDAWSITGARLPWHSVLAFSSKSQNLPNESTYTPDYLFRTVIDV